MVMGRVSCAAVWPAVLSILFFLRLLDRPALSRAVPLILSLWAMLAADQQIALYGLVWLSVLACAAAPFRVRRMTAPSLAGAVALTIAFVAPAAYWLYVQPFTGQINYSVPAASEAATYSYPASLLWTPSMIWRVYGTVLPVGLIAALAIAVSRPSILPWLAGAVTVRVAVPGPIRRRCRGGHSVRRPAPASGNGPIPDALPLSDPRRPRSRHLRRVCRGVAGRAGAAPQRCHCPGRGSRGDRHGGVSRGLRIPAETRIVATRARGRGGLRASRGTHSCGDGTVSPSAGRRVD